MNICVLVVDDSADDRTLVTRELTRHFGQVEVLQAGTPEALDEALAQGRFQVTITDYCLRFTDGLTVLRRLKAQYPDRPVLMFTGSGNEEVAVEAMKAGLDDYLTKTAKHYLRIGYAVRACLEHAERRRELEQVLARESLAKARLEIALQSAGMGSWQHDLRSGEISCSDEIGPMFGRRAGFCHRSIDDWLADIHPDDRAAVQEAARRAVQEGGTARLAYRALGADGNLRWLATSGRVLRDARGMPTLAIGTKRDISAEVIARQDLERQRTELDVANRQKNDFLAILAHELRNPLAAAGYSVALLRRDAPSADTVARAAEVIERQVLHMGRLLDELLDLSRITRGRIVLERRPLDLRRIVDLACDTVRAALLANAHTLRIDLPPVPVGVEGDELRLVQVLGNLLSNATKFTPPGGSIAVRLRSDDGRALLEVSDNGVGIDPARLGEVFAMFSQAQAKAHGGPPGLGIGLAVARSLVELHGGTLTAHSAGPNQGTLLRLCLPLAQAAAAPQADPTAPAAAAPLSILLADDNADAADMLADFLRMQGHQVHTAYDGEAAMALAGQVRPRVMVLDIGMPRATGYEVARWVRAQPWGAHTVLAAVTGWGSDQDNGRALAAGFDVRLVKPVHIDQLLAVIANAEAPAH